MYTVSYTSNIRQVQNKNKRLKINTAVYYKIYQKEHVNLIQKVINLTTYKQARSKVRSSVVHMRISLQPFVGVEVSDLLAALVSHVGEVRLQL